MSTVTKLLTISDSTLAPVGGTTSLVAQTPSGTINGSNTSFTVTGTITLLFLNGVQQTAGGVDYTISGSTITYVVAPSTGSAHVAY